MDIDSEHGGPDNNNAIAHPNKRRKCTSRSITELPNELLIKICQHIRPGDLLSLARTCKPFRNYFMRKSRQWLWLDALNNVRGLPSCPPGFTEPQYSAILFSRFCTACGSAKKSQLDVVLLVRLCDPCQQQCLALLVDTHQVPADIRAFIHKSNVFGKGKRGQLPDARVLKSDVYHVVKTLDAKTFEGDNALEESKKQMAGMVLERKQQSEKITRALELFENETAWERKEAQTKRRQEIQRRCIDEFKTVEEDLQFNWDSPRRKKWYKFIDGHSFLSDREWGEIRPKLKQLLDENRAARLAKEEESGRRSQSNYQAQLERRRILHLRNDPVMGCLYNAGGTGMAV
ncbi:unnamed protein product [Rhizoctonia solani]|uniref:F-box domain-containing protein n=1 Tax=Rhizoctonia solani TaxID=456999 RepID=A0A8H3GJZ8_9AGAM|nr:unnamed protein product [Rhizoctonia solani]